MVNRRKDREPRKSTRNSNRKHGKVSKLQSGKRRRSKRSEESYSGWSSDEIPAKRVKDKKQTPKKVSVTQMRCGIRSYEPFHDKFLSIDEIMDYLRKLESRYPDKVQIQTIGQSKLGNPIALARISEGSLSDDTKPAVMIEAGSNGSDLYAVSSALCLIDFLAKNASSVLIMDYLIIPCSNPDAYINVLNRMSPTTNDAVLSLSNNYPVTLGLSNVKAIPCEEFLDAIETWKENFCFGSPECSTITTAVTIYKCALKMFISLQENGEKIVYPYGFPGVEVHNIDDLIKVAKSGQAGAKKRCFNIGSIHELCGLTFGTLVDYINSSQNSIKFNFIVHVNNKQCNEATPEKILPYGEDVINAIKLMTRSVYMIIKKEEVNSRLMC